MGGVTPLARDTAQTSSNLSTVRWEGPEKSTGPGLKAPVCLGLCRYT